jgi:hypothetical protein
MQHGNGFNKEFPLDHLSLLRTHPFKGEICPLIWWLLTEYGYVARKIGGKEIFAP